MGGHNKEARVLNSARKSMPTLDYVSIVRSVYGDRRALLAGAFASASAAGLTAYKAHSIPLALVTCAFLIFGAARYFNMQAFWRANIDSDDADAAERWELRAMIGGSTVALTYGMWCLVTMAWTSDPYAELVSASLSIAVMVGLIARNFGLDRLVATQLLLVIVPLAIGLFLHGDAYHAILAVLLVVLLSSFRRLAGDIRTILLSAVHGRVEASRLAAELDMAMSTMQHGLCMLDESGVVTLANEHAVRTFSLINMTNLVGQSFQSVLGKLGENGRLPRTAVDRLLDIVSRRASGKVLLCLPHGRYYEVTVSSRQERSVLLFEDISERVAAEERISFMARHDALTSLPNRTYFSEMVTEDLATRERNGEPARPVALMILDIDDFKHVNDTLGHIVGDRLLTEVAQRLRGSVGPEAVLARLGGDEFIIYRGTIGDPAEADAEVAAIIAAFATPFAIDGMALSTNISVGLVTSTSLDDHLDSLMTKADLALYMAKGDGKGRSQIFHAQMDIDYHYRQRLKADLRTAVRTGGLTLAFQPQLDIASRKVVACEALARWDHPELGSIPPSTFIPLAEEMGLISEITAWVLQAATLQCQSWPGDIGVAVNISAHDFRGGDIGTMVARALELSGLPPARLEVEVTETVLIEERDIALKVLNALAAQGISIALDDFGTGYSSLSYLSVLPFTKLKIDRSFVVDIATDQRSLKLLANVARLGRDLGLTVTAEGVETEEQLNAMLAKTRVEQVQGYFFSRPLPPRDIAELISRLNANPAQATLIRKHG
ncbi:diguanylate cyclase (GGDEF)-like protein [Devosia sp. UYZn731]